MSPAVEKSRPLSYHALHVWALQMQIMMNAGVPILTALRSISRSDDPELADTCAHLAARISQGHSLSQAMRSLGPVFSPFVANLVVVGEQSGKLAIVLERISSRSARRAKMEKAVVNAMAYPAFLAVVSIAMSLCMALYMFPKLMPFLQGLGVPLPWPTRLLLWFSDNFSWMLLVVVVLAAYAGRLVTSSSKGRMGRVRSWLIYRSPLFGGLNADRVYSDTLDDLYLLVEANCDLIKGLSTLHVPWPEFEDRIAACCELVRQGENFSDAAEKSRMVPNSFALQIRSGEETGRMPQMFKLMAEQLHESVTLKAQAIVQLLEPMILMGMGLVTGFVVVATFLPLYTMATAAL